MKTLRTLLTLSMAAPLAACATPSQPPAQVEPEMTLVAYDVPHGYGDEVWTLLNRTLSRGSEQTPVGRAAMGPGDKLVVVAPKAVQLGVGKFLTELDALDTPPEPAPAVTLSYWLVVAEPADKADAPVALADVQPALDEIGKTQGPMRFALLERMQVTSRERRAMTEGAAARISQNATLVRENVIADVEIDLGHYRIDTQVKSKPGQFVVLGQTGFNTRMGPATAPKPFGDADDLTLFYILRADTDA